MLMVSKLEDLLQTFYGYFSSSPNHHFQFTKLVAIVKIKGPKVIWNLKTKWISMFQPLRCVKNNYRNLIIKMETICNLLESTKANLVNLYDIVTILGLACIYLLMLKFVNALMKFAQSIDNFICDYIVIVNICTKRLEIQLPLSRLQTF